MTQPATGAAPAAPTTAAAPAAPTTQNQTPTRTTVHDRASALLERLSAEEGSSESGEAEGSEGTRPAETTQEAKPAPADEASEKRRTDRLERIAKVRAEEAKAKQRRQSEQQTRQQSTQQNAEVEKLRARISELEPMNDVFKDEASLLAAAESRGMSVEKLVQWMRTRLTDPSAVAQRQAKTVEDALRQELGELRNRLEQSDAQRAKEKQQESEQRAQQENAQRFVSQVGERTADAPLTSSFMKRHGAHGLVAFANQFVVPLLPESYTLDELHDHTEQLLEEFQFSGGSNLQREASASGTSHTSKSGADQPVTTLGSSLPAERSMVTEAIPLHKMPLEERARFLKDKYSRE